MTSHAAAITRQTMADALLACGPWHAGHDDDALIDHASAQARAVEQDAAAVADVVYAYQRAARRAEAHGITPPEGFGHRGALARLSCPYWWRRKLRRLSARRCEQRERLLGRVSKGAAPYVSHQGHQRRQEQKARNLRAMRDTTATNQAGQSFTLEELAAKGQADPGNRRAELMLRIRDTEAVSRERGHVGYFYTITTPSRFHPVVSKPWPRPNPKYSGETPREAQAYLRGVWARIRAKLAREELGIYGIRVAEPHHDGTPHWHLLIWMRPEDVRRVTAIMRDYVKREDAEELDSPKARRARFDAKRIDPKRGTAAGYVAKYISKSINGTQFDAFDKETGKPLEDMAPRIESWASTWGIRQFQFIGLPSVTAWRELRRLSAEDIESWEAATRPDPEASAIMTDAHRAADGGSWVRYLEVQGGPMTPRADQPVKPWRVVRQDAEGVLADPTTGLVSFDVLGRYGDAVATCWGVTVTSETGTAEYLTRKYRWTIERKPEAGGVDLEGLTFGGSAAAWTRVNNCTQPAEQDPRKLFEPWELTATDAFRRMKPAPEPGRLDEIRRDIAAEADDYRHVVESMAIHRQKRRDVADQRKADERRIDQGRQVIAAALLDRTLSPADLTPEMIEVLTA